jgi:hypothetical protein
MNTEQEKRFKMNQNAHKFLTINSAKVSALPGYSKLFEALGVGINQIKVLSEIQVVDTSGLVKHKNQLKQVLALKVFSVSTKLQAYARFTKNEVLLNEVNFTESILKYASDEKLREYAKVVLSRLMEYIAELEGFNITEDTQTSLQADIDAFNEAVPKIGIAAATTKENTARLKQAFANNNKILEGLDAIVEILKEKSPDFYNEYKRVRKIDKTGRGHLSVIPSCVLIYNIIL